MVDIILVVICLLWLIYKWGRDGSTKENFEKDTMDTLAQNSDHVRDSGMPIGFHEHGRLAPGRGASVCESLGAGVLSAEIADTFSRIVEKVLSTCETVRRSHFKLNS